jgi:hypothetical protein
MYEVLENPKRMTFSEMYEEFNGKWVYTVKPEKPPGTFITAIPVVIADIPYEGDETGIYDKIDNEYGGDTMDITGFMNKYHIFGFSEGTQDSV